MPPAIDGNQLMIWLGCLAFVIWIVQQAMGLVDRFSAKPPLHERYATIEALAKVAGRVEEIEKKRSEGVHNLHQRIDNLAPEFSEALSGTREHLKDELAHTREEIAGLRATLGATRDSVQALTAKLDLLRSR